MVLGFRVSASAREELATGVTAGCPAPWHWEIQDLFVGFTTAALKSLDLSLLSSFVGSKQIVFSIGFMSDSCGFRF